jgi:anti-sigma factor ChrR (cupin superfamily)
VLRVRADFDSLAWVAPEDQRWTASPQPGVERVLLDRIGDEVAVATSLVRYQRGSRFTAHRHERGEEFLVLDGVFADEYGEYPAGTYVRNPPGTSHAPRSEPGCLLFVKLRQFLPGDRAAVVIDTTALPAAANGTVRVHRLFEFGAETVCLLDGAAGTGHTLAPVGVPRELLALRGEAAVLQHRMTPGAWLRVPAGTPLTVDFVRAGRLFVKTRPVLA